MVRSTPDEIFVLSLCQSVQHISTTLVCNTSQPEKHVAPALQTRSPLNANEDPYGSQNGAFSPLILHTHKRKHARHTHTHTHNP